MKASHRSNLSSPQSLDKIQNSDIQHLYIKKPRLQKQNSKKEYTASNTQTTVRKSVTQDAQTVRKSDASNGYNMDILIRQVPSKQNLLAEQPSAQEANSSQEDNESALDGMNEARRICGIGLREQEDLELPN